MGKEAEVRKWALALVGHPYVWGNEPYYNVGGDSGADPYSSDCSGLVYGVFRKSGVLFQGGTMPRLTADGYWRRAVRLSAPEQVGDCYFFLGRSGKCYHIGLYIGHGQCIEARGRKWGIVATTVDAVNKRGAKWGRLPVDLSVTYYRLLKLIQPYMEGEDVRYVQRRLNALIWAGLQTDGEYGPLTEKAVKRFQRDKGLEVDGRVGPITWKALGR